MAEPRAVVEARARLGEGPVWDGEAGALIWVDILNHRVHRWQPSTSTARIYDVGEVVSCAVPAENGEILVALRHALAFLDARTGDVRRRTEVAKPSGGGRFNDGACDSRGRFWVGMLAKQQGQGTLYRFDPDGTLHALETGLTMPNGLGWSPDGDTFYLTDSADRTIYAYDFDAAAGEISGRRVFVHCASADATPDGLAVDTEGCVWSAQWDGGCLIRFAPDGRESARVVLPVPLVTSCAFGGSDGRDLYITTASVGLGEDRIEQSVRSGDLFHLCAPVAGLPSGRFSGRPLPFGGS